MGLQLSLPIIFRLAELLVAKCGLKKIRYEVGSRPGLAAACGRAGLSRRELRRRSERSHRQRRSSNSSRSVGHRLVW